jgi:hypothetical protein
MVVSDNQQTADQVVQLAFDFARAQAASPAKPAGVNQTPGKSPDSLQYQALTQMAATLDGDVRDLQVQDVNENSTWEIVYEVKTMRQLPSDTASEQ